MRSRIESGAIALACGALLAAACSSPSGPDADPEVGSTEKNALTIPAGLQFFPFLCDGAPAFDPAGDTPGAKDDHRDVVGNPNVDEAALYYASDPATDLLYLRMRVSDNPSSNPTNLKSFGWAYLFDSEERLGALPEYERLVHANGTGGNDKVSVFDNETPEEDNASDPAETDLDNPVTIYTPVTDFWIVQTPTDVGLPETNFSGDPDFFITYAIRWQDLELGPPATVTQGVTKGQAVVLWAGTTNSNNAIDADFACSDFTIGGDPPLTELPGDPQVLSCGNGVVEGTETCDDGNQIDGDGCSSLCQVAACGDGVLNIGEGCDDGNTAPGDGCDANCLIEDFNPCNQTAPGNTGNNSCASGVCDPTEGPTGQCEPVPSCGNSVLEAGEGCDDGNNTDGDGCNAGCLIEDTNPCNTNPAGDVDDASCASGVCDNSPSNPPGGVCEPANQCGNSVLEAGEGCDDGNTLDGDGCNAGCLVEDGDPCNQAAPGEIGDTSCENGLCDVSGGLPGICLGAGCGNGILEAGEGCDDGNLISGDGCNASCFIEDGQDCNADPAGEVGDPSCASGICDETQAGPGRCEPANSCGNSVHEAGEGCDDGNNNTGDGCDSNCKIENNIPCNTDPVGDVGDVSCQSGICDETPNNPPGGICEPQNTCGNSVLELGEGCDDGNTVAGDGCNATCRVENFNPCNDVPPGNIGNTSCASGICDQTGGGAGFCEPPGCGNGRIEAGEACDDGDIIPGDGCSATCLKENGQTCTADGECESTNCNSDTGLCDSCGNGVLDAGEACDDGNNTAGDGCNAVCLKENGEICAADGECESGGCNDATGLCDSCGNGVLEAGEGCDDGNNANGDGCNAGCLIEDTVACNGTAPGEIGDTSCASGICDETEGGTGICEPANSCGNSEVEGTEACDDGNNAPGDGCDAACLKEPGEICGADAECNTGGCNDATGLCDSCGNGVLEAGEGCDDGNNAGGDGCNAGCLIEDTLACNGTAPGEIGDTSCASGVCDETEGGTGICEPANSCGNSEVEAGEACDDGNNAPGDGCNAVCLKENGEICAADGECESGGCNDATGLCDSCGNGVLEAGEGCDDGNNTDGDGCNASCLIEDGTVCNDTAPGEIGDSSCASGICDVSGGGAGVCEPAGCGNNVLEPGEGCDDGNTIDGDGCDAGCLVEDFNPCNGTAPGEIGDASCASGICDETEGGAGICEPIDTCGNSELEAGEGCDDGNTTAGDGCDTACLIEDGIACNGDAAGEVGDASCASGICDETEGGTGICEPAGCGNGELEAGEGCDDGNNTAGDGCNAACLIETGETCNNTAPGEIGDDSCESGFCNMTGNVCEDPNDHDMDGIPDVIDLDDDNDGIPDAEEGEDDLDGDGVPNHQDLDADGDGIPDVVEAGHGGADADGDGALDCEAGFGDNGLCDEVETAPDSGVTDYNGDTLGPDEPLDTDGDGIDDYKDLDADNDGIPDLVEGDSGCLDADADSVCDGPDSDGDGIPDSIDGVDGFGDDGYTDPPNTDGDSVPDFQDLDSDNDAISDLVEGGYGCADADDNAVCDGPDGDGDGIVDSIDDLDGHGDPGRGDPTDTDNDGEPDYQDLNSDNDGLLDIEEGGHGDLDGNGDGMIDDDGDGDGDGIADPADTQPNDFGGLGDTDIDDDGDGTPNFQDPDSNNDGVDDGFGVSGGGCQVGGTGDAGTMLLLLGLWGVLMLGRRRRSLAQVLTSRGARWAGLAVALAVASVASPVHAQELAGDFPVERFRLSVDRDGILNAEWGGVPRHLDWDIGLWLGAEDDPLVVYMGDDRERVGTLVTHRVAGTLVGAIALWNRLQVGLEAPVIVSQGQEDNIPGIMSGDLSSFGLGDLRLVAKLNLLSRNGLHLAIAPSITLPSGGGSDFRGDDGVTFAPEAIASQDWGRVRASVNLGYRARSQTQLADLTVDDEVYMHLGAGFRPGSRDSALELALATAVSTRASSVFGDFNTNHFELMGGANYDFAGPWVGVAAAGLGLRPGFGTPDWRIALGLRWSKRVKDRDGDGILDASDSCPDEPEDVDTWEDSDGCPDPDNDGDGVLDVADGAPLDPEDKDGFQDEDGVPDPDNDKDGIADSDDQCPLEAEVVNSFQDEDGCPDEEPDTDNDGLKDSKDECPNEPEDMDSFQDENGCPDPDNDEDGVLDTADGCPNTAGPVENKGCPDTDRDGDTVVDRKDNCPDEPGDPANQGCKKKQLVVLQQGNIQILDKVYFATNRDIIQRRSYRLLRNVAQVLNSHPEIKKVRVEGHTDDRGKDEFNMDLSQRRVDSVVKFLVNEGVDVNRLIPKGYGETQPVDDNKTARGRANNRRVEFKILDQ